MSNVEFYVHRFRVFLEHKHIPSSPRDIGADLPPEEHHRRIPFHSQFPDRGFGIGEFTSFMAYALF